MRLIFDATQEVLLDVDSVDMAGTLQTLRDCIHICARACAEIDDGHSCINTEHRDIVCGTCKTGCFECGHCVQYKPGGPPQGAPSFQFVDTLTPRTRLPRKSRTRRQSPPRAFS